jgi:hypothetical protein
VFVFRVSREMKANPLHDRCLHNTVHLHDGDKEYITNNDNNKL